MDLSQYSKEEIERAKSLISQGYKTSPLPKTTDETPPVLYVFRHGQSQDNADMIFSGWRDSPLTELGRKQAKILAEKLKDKKIDLAITSRLSRAKETLDIALSDHPEIKIEIDDGIIERSYGDLQGASKLEMYLKDPSEAEKFRRSYDYPAKNGESLKMVEERVKRFLDKLLPRMRAEKINVAVSCHGNSMRAIRRWMEDLTPEQMCKIEDPLGQDFASYKIGDAI